MKTRWIAAAFAAFFMFTFFSVAAYAAPVDETPVPEDVAEIENTEHEAVSEYAPETEEPGEDEYTDMDMDDLSAMLSLFMLMSMMDSDEPPAQDTNAPNPALPPGTATVIDYSTDPDGRLFYTIMTPDEHVFYLVIDKNSNTDNVYFLNAVTVADLLPLAQSPPQTQGGTVTPPPTAETETEQPEATPPPAEQEQEQGGGNAGTLIFIVIIVVLGGGAGWYFKIYKPKQQNTADSEEYDPSLDGTESDYADDWGGGIDDANDYPAWGEDTDSDGETE